MAGEEGTACFLKDFPPSSTHSRYYVRITSPAYSKHYHCALKEADQSQHSNRWAGLDSCPQILRPPDLLHTSGAVQAIRKRTLSRGSCMLAAFYRKEGLTKYPWLAWNSLYRLGWPQPHRDLTASAFGYWDQHEPPHAVPDKMFK